MDMQRRKQAEDVLLDQTCFALDAKSFAAFQAMVDKPPSPTQGLRRTLNARAPWEPANVAEERTVKKAAKTVQRGRS